MARGGSSTAWSLRRWRGSILIWWFTPSRVKVETVQYHKLNAMLLNELQKHHRRLDALKAENADLKARLEALERFVLPKEALAQK